MRKILTLILVIMTLSLQGYAQESNSNNSSSDILLEYEKYNEPSERHRAPLRLKIDAYYNAENETISVSSVGGASGQVYLYCDDVLVGTDSEINTTFAIVQPGLYRIEIIGEGWIATGSIQI